MFQFVAFPGPGVLVADASEGNEYIQGAGADAFKHKPKNRYLETYPNGVVPSEHHVVAEIDPAPGTVSMNRDLLLQRGRSLTVTVLGPDGKPLSGNQVAGMSDRGYGYSWEKSTTAGGIDLYDPRFETGQKTDCEILEPEAGIGGPARPARG